MNNFGFEKTVRNVRKHRDIKLVTTGKKINYTASEPIYHATKFFSKNLVFNGNELNKCQNGQASIFRPINSVQNQESYV